MPEVTRTPVRRKAALMRWVRARISGAGHDGLMNSWVSCRSRIRSRLATVSIRSSGSAKRLTSGLVLSESVKAMWKPWGGPRTIHGSHVFSKRAMPRCSYLDRRRGQSGAAGGQRFQCEIRDHRQVVGRATGLGIGPALGESAGRTAEDPVQLEKRAPRRKGAEEAPGRQQLAERTADFPMPVVE